MVRLVLFGTLKWYGKNAMKKRCGTVGTVSANFLYMIC